MLFHGPSPHHVSLLDNFGGLLRPRGKTYTPLRGMISLSLIASSNVVILKFLRNSRSALQPVEVCRHALSMRFFARFFANCTISINPIAYKRYSNSSQNSSEIWCEFGVCRVKALGGVAVRNLVSEE